MKSLIKKLEEFELAFGALNSAWQNFNYDDDLNKEMGEDYPFEKCFDELNSDVAKWVDKSSDRIRKLLQERIDARAKLEFELFSNSKVKLSKKDFNNLVNDSLEAEEAYLYHNETYIELTENGNNCLCIGRCDWLEANENLKMNELRLFLYMAEENGNENNAKWARDMLGITEKSWYY